MSSKTCTTCGVTKPFEDFQVRAASRDGRTASCRSCLSIRDRLRANRIERLEARRAYCKTAEGRAAHTRATTVYRRRRTDRARAHNAVSKAIARGALKPWPVCAIPECSGQPEAHHSDYTRPLDVVWLCHAHHMQAHALTRPPLPDMEQGYEVDAAGTFVG